MSIAAVTTTSAGRSGGFGLRLAVPAGLLAIAALGWWWSVRMADEMTAWEGWRAWHRATMSFGGFMVAWAAMMAAMMLPAVLPVVRLYGRAAAAGRAAPVPFFASGYLAAVGRHRAARLLRVASPRGAARRRRSVDGPPRRGGAGPGGALATDAAEVGLPPPLPISALLLHAPWQRDSQTARGGSHGGEPCRRFCIGCCWALFAVLVAVGTMSIWWMVALTLLIVLERNSPAGGADRGRRLASARGDRDLSAARADEPWNS